MVGRKKRVEDSPKDSTIIVEGSDTSTSTKQSSNVNPIPRPGPIINSEDFEIVEQVETDRPEFELPKGVPPGKKFTRIRIVKEGHEVEEVNEEEMKNIVRSKKDEIQKIIIEQVSHKSADRMSLILTPDDLKQDARPKEKQAAIENQRFPSLKICSEAELKAAAEKYRTLSSAELLSLEMRFNKWFYDGEVVVPQSREENNDHALVVVSNSEKSEAIDDGEHPEDFVYRKQIYIRKNGSKSGQYFYRAKNHVELYNVGNKYFEDYKNGITHFGFYGHGLREVREKTVFGLYAYFTYEIDAKITIFTSSIDSSFYFRTIEGLKVEKRFLKGEDIAFEVYVSKNLEIIEFSTLSQVVNKMQKFTIEDLLVEYFAKSKIIFWDLPEIEQMDSAKEIFFPIIRHIDNVSILVESNFSKSADFSDTLSYFKKYGIPLKGVLMSHNFNEKEKKAA